MSKELKNKNNAKKANKFNIKKIFNKQFAAKALCAVLCLSMLASLVIYLF